MNTRWIAAAGVAIAMLQGHALAQGPNERPWDDANAIIIMDPYEGNDVNWDQAVTDKRLKAVIHRAAIGLTVDNKFLARANEAKSRGLYWGAYLLGKPGDPIQQADLLLDLAGKTGAKFLAIDIEDVNPSKFMTLANAAKFMEHINAKTGRYPAVYINHNVYNIISQSFDKSSTFAKGPLWIARFQPKLDISNKRVWDDYAVWQFSSEINCSKKTKCLYRIPGTLTDMDVNVFRGDAQALGNLFK